MGAVGSVCAKDFDDTVHEFAAAQPATEMADHKGVETFNGLYPEPLTAAAAGAAISEMLAMREELACAKLEFTQPYVGPILPVALRTLSRLK